MNSIIAIDPAASACDVHSLHAVLARLGAYIDAEVDNLDALFEHVAQDDVTDDLSLLWELHLDAGSADLEVYALLKTARGILGRLLGKVRMICADSALCSRASHCEARVLWAGARLQDILNDLDQTLSA